MAHRYGRGTFTAHPNYISYMNKIVHHENFRDMPNAVSEDGRINWQVSSGKTTSFYKYYVARSSWWIKKANELGLKGTGKSDDRFSIAARLINPFKKRPCRLCGVEQHIGYMYLNQLLANRWNKIFETKPTFIKAQFIGDALHFLEARIGKDALLKELKTIFPERFNILDNDYKGVFENSMHIKSNYLSPGFMANPPDRLDGFHDYCLNCRQKNDPGRSEENMASYNHDRRAFAWWAEGDWLVADALYNKASAGVCSNCGKTVEKVSPDHIGPLACGFKHIPLFSPLCQSCNSSKNRRFTAADVKKLIDYEKTTGDSVASWQVRKMWDVSKNNIRNDGSAKELSDSMRSLQDFYLHFLGYLHSNGFSYYLIHLLSPENAGYSIEFINLNSSALTFDSYEKKNISSNGRKSLESRTVRIAFEELIEYQGQNRKVKKFHLDTKNLEEKTQLVIDELLKYNNEVDFQRWDSLTNAKTNNTYKDLEDSLAKVMTGAYKNQKMFTKAHFYSMALFDYVGETMARQLQFNKVLAE